MPRPNSRKPTAKVTAGGGAGAVTVLAVFVANQLGVNVPPEVASAFTVVAGFVASYFTPSSYGKG